LSLPDSWLFDLSLFDLPPPDLLVPERSLPDLSLLDWSLSDLSLPERSPPFSDRGSFSSPRSRPSPPPRPLVAAADFPPPRASVEPEARSSPRAPVDCASVTPASSRIRSTISALRARDGGFLPNVDAMTTSCSR